MTTFFLYLQAQVHLKREGKRTWTTTLGTTMCGKETWPPFKQQRWSWESWVTSTQKTIWPDILNSVCKTQNCVSLQYFIEWWGDEDSEWIFWEMVHDWLAIARLQGFTSASFFLKCPGMLTNQKIAQYNATVLMQTLLVSSALMGQYMTRYNLDVELWKSDS